MNLTDLLLGKNHFKAIKYLIHYLITKIVLFLYKKEPFQSYRS